MKTTVRANTFETNSSSVHSLVFSKDYDKMQPGEIGATVRCGEYGWDEEEYYSPCEKLSYLWTAITYMHYQDMLTLATWKEYFIEALELDENTQFEVLDFESDDYGGYGGYVDHAGGLNTLITAFAEDPELLRCFVYGRGCVETDNDNHDPDPGSWSEQVGWRQYEQLLDLGGQWVYIKGN